MNSPKENDRAGFPNLMDEDFKLDFKDDSTSNLGEFMEILESKMGFPMYFGAGTNFVYEWGLHKEEMTYSRIRSSRSPDSPRSDILATGQATAPSDNAVYFPEDLISISDEESPVPANGIFRSDDSWPTLGGDSSSKGRTCAESEASFLSENQTSVPVDINPSTSENWHTSNDFTSTTEYNHFVDDALRGSVNDALRGSLQIAGYASLIPEVTNAAENAKSSAVGSIEHVPVGFTLNISKCSSSRPEVFNIGTAGSELGIPLLASGISNSAPVGTIYMPVCSSSTSKFLLHSGASPILSCDKFSSSHISLSMKDLGFLSKGDNSTPYNVLETGKVMLDSEELISESEDILSNTSEISSDVGVFTSDLRGSTSDLLMSMSDFGVSTSDFGVFTTDLGGSASDLGGYTSDLGGSTSDLGGSTSDLGGSASDLGMSTSDLGGSTLDHGVSTSDLEVFIPGLAECITHPEEVSPTSGKALFKSREASLGIGWINWQSEITSLYPGVSSESGVLSLISPTRSSESVGTNIEPAGTHTESGKTCHLGVTDQALEASDQTRRKVSSESEETGLEPGSTNLEFGTSFEYRETSLSYGETIQGTGETEPDTMQTCSELGNIQSVKTSEMRDNESSFGGLVVGEDAWFAKILSSGKPVDFFDYCHVEENRVRRTG